MVTLKPVTLSVVVIDISDIDFKISLLRLRMGLTTRFMKTENRMPSMMTTSDSRQSSFMKYGTMKTTLMTV